MNKLKIAEIEQSFGKREKVNDFNNQLTKNNRKSKMLLTSTYAKIVHKLLTTVHVFFSYTTVRLKHRIKTGAYYDRNSFTLGARYVYSGGELNNNNSQKYVAMTFWYRFHSFS